MTVSRRRYLRPPPRRRFDWHLFRIDAAIIAYALAAALVLWFAAQLIFSGPAGARDDALQSWLRTWIPTHCCVTNRCCFQVSPRDVISLANDNWQIVASGQILKLTNWSKDGQYWRCACDQINGVWIVHAVAYTHCIFPPMQTTNKAMKGM